MMRRMGRGELMRGTRRGAAVRGHRRNDVICRLTRRVQLALLPLLLPLMASCGDQAQGGPMPVAAAAPRQVIVALDLSGSQSDGRRAQARSTVEQVIDGLAYGERIVLLQVHQRAAAEDDAVRWAETVPPPPQERAPTTLDRERRDAAVQAARSVARTMFQNEIAGRLPTTDLLATMHIAGEYVRDWRGPTTLLLLSDMLQSAHGVEMSQTGGVPSADWVHAQHAAGLLPRLENACIAVIGADATSANGIAVRAFWLTYFEQAGALFSPHNYRLIATDPSRIGCN